jgi:putative ABC transport system permease protein
MMVFARDLRIAVRSLLKSRGFALTAVLTLAMGMTLCITAVTVMKAYLLEDLPYPESRRLYSVRFAPPGENGPRNLEALDWASLADVIEHPIAWDLDMFTLVGGEQAEAAPGAWVTPGFVEALGIRPAFGPGFEPAAFTAGGPNVALISHRLWTRRFSSDPTVVGKTFTAYVSDRPQEAESFTIAGVLPASFWHTNIYTDILTPLRAPTFPYMVRLKPGVSPDDAARRIGTLVRTGGASVPEGWLPVLVSTHEDYVARSRPMLRAATAAAALVLLVACANVAALLLVRAIRREKEVAVRIALGARRLAIARLLLAEGIVLGGAALAIALVAARMILTSLVPIVEVQLGRRAPGGATAFAFDGGMLALAAMVGLVTAIVCTLAPLASVRRGRHAELQGGRWSTEAARTRRLRSALIVLEIAASLTLLAGTTLMMRSVIALTRTDLGFDAERVLMTSITLRQNRYPDAASRSALFSRIESRLAALSGAESVGLTTAWPVQQPQLAAIDTDSTPGGGTRAAVHRVNDGYFAAGRIALAEGRLFSAIDQGGSEPVAVISRALARRLWPDGAIGRRLAVPQEQGSGPVSRLVVGIVHDVRQGASDEELGDLYVPLRQAPGRFAFVLLRTAGDPSGWLQPMAAAFRDVDPEISVQTARPLQVIVDDLSARPRFLATLLTAFSGTAALLALIGVYGVMAYAIRQREREIAVRMALGADPARLTRLFVRQGAVMLMAGLGLGLGGALASGRVIESQLFNVTARDPLSLAVAVAAFAVAGLLAIWWPSRRAASTDPAIALRAE